MTEEKYNTFWPRVGAAFIDAIVIFIPLTILNYLILSVWQIKSTFFLFLWFIFNSLAFFIYSVLMHGFLGQTIGKMNFKIKVRDLSEAKLTMRQALLRDIIPIILIIIAIIFETPSIIQNDHYYYNEQLRISTVILKYLNYVWILIEVATMLLNEKRRAVHDYIAKSVVIKYGDYKKYVPSEKETIYVLYFVTAIIIASLFWFIYFLVFTK